MVSAMSGPGRIEVRRFASLDSTNRYLMDEARAGAPDGVVAVADHQTAGRGRLGRRWEAPPGACLLVSVLWRPPLGPDELHLCTAAVALAGADAAAEVAVRPELKWPNDLVVAGSKVGGVLAEWEGPAAVAGPPAVVVGMGLNVSWPGPPGVGGTSLEEAAGRAVDREALLEGVLRHAARRRALLESPDGRRAVAAEFAACCSTVGRAVRVEQVGRTFTGVATGLTVQGHLVVDAGGERVTVAVGDVVHLRVEGDGGGPQGPGAPRGPGPGAV